MRSLLSISLFLIVCGSSAMGGENTEQPSPNILLILSDDLGMNDLSAFGGENVETPALEALAARGTRFTRYYTEATCSPSRAALLSGLFPTRTGFMPNGRGLSADLNTLPRALASKGYQTHHVGKWHVGDTTKYALPPAQGFHSSFYFPNQWLLAGKKDAQGNIIPARPTYFDPWLRTNRQAARQHRGHLNDILTDHVLQILDGDQHSPWFINLWYYAPHAPLQPAARYTDNQRRKNGGRENFEYLLRQMDENIGRLVSRLRERDELENTIIVFAGDNGGTNQAAANNAPYDGSKGELREGGLRAPLLIVAPGITNQARDTDSIASVVDIFPTLMELGPGVSMIESLDGVSLLSVLSGEPTEPRLLAWEMYGDLYRSYSLLTADGSTRYWTPYRFTPEAVSVHVNDLNRDPSGRDADIIEEKSLPAGVAEDYQRWHLDQHLLSVRESSINNQRALVGNDMQRSPGFGQYTFAFGIESGYAGRGEALVLLEQPGIWQLTLDSSGDATVTMFDQSSKSAVLLDRACNSIAVTGIFRHALTNWKDQSQVSQLGLWVNGQSIRTWALKDIPTEIPLKQPTYISDRVLNPTLLNVALHPLEPWSPERVNNEVCGPDN